MQRTLADLSIEEFERIANAACVEARLRAAKQGQSVVGIRDGKLVTLTPEQILASEAVAGRKEQAAD